MIKSLNKYLFLVLVIFLAAVHSNVAQIKNKVANGWVFEDFEQDLSQVQKYILSLKEDSSGFIWMGTYNGVNVYDGKNYKFYKDYFNENKGFKGQRVRDIFEDSKGRILVGMRTMGINVYMPKKGEFINQKKQLFKDADTDYIQNFSENKNGEILIASDHCIITIRLDNKGEISHQTIFKPTLNKGEYIRKGLLFKDDYLIVTNKRIISKKNKTSVYETNNIRNCKIRYNKVWILKNNDIGILDTKSGSFQSTEFKFPETKENLLDFEFLSENILFVGTPKSLLQINLNESSKAINTNKLIVREYYRHSVKQTVGVSRVFKDTSGSLYFNFIGNYGGLMKLNKEQLNYKYIGLPEPYNKERFIANIFHDSFGLYWLNTPYGLFAYNSKKNDFHRFSNDSIMAIKGVDSYGIFEDSKNDIWLNTNKGIISYNRSKKDFKVYEKPAGINPAYYPAAFLDEDNQLWYPTKKGVSKFDTNTKTHTDYNIGEPTTMYLDKRNTLWVNIQSEALYAYNVVGDSLQLKNSYKEFFSTTNTRLFYSPVRQIQFDDKDRIWITGFNGIYVYDYKSRKIVKHFNKNNLLKDDNIFELIKNSDGNFWVRQSTTEAFCIDADSFEIIETLPSWLNIMPTLRGNSGPVYQDKKGQIFTNGLDGCFVYNPADLKTSTKPIKIVLSEFSVNGKPTYSNFTGTQNLTPYQLNYDKNSIEIHIKEVGQNNFPQKEFAYRMKGISDEWDFSKNLQPLNYNDLQPNTYTLEVKSTSDGKLWSEPLVLASFKISPPWWKTTYAYISYLLILALLGYSFYKIQLNRRLAESESQKLREVDDFKNKFYQNITHEFRTPLTVIIGMAESLESKASKMIKRNANQLLKLVNELLEIGKIESNYTNLELSSKDIVKFTKYCMESLESLAKNKEISLRFQTNINNLIMDFDVEKMQLVLNNLLSNAIKFTPANGTIDVSVNTINDFVNISVKDSGIGISEENTEHIFERYFQEKKNQSTKGSGIGLTLSRELIKLMNGSIVAKNNDDKGACFTITLPVKNDVVFIDENTNLNSNLPIENTSKEDETIILVIEDNEDVLTYISSVLNPLYKIISASNGKVGYEKSLELIPDLIISDVMMPIMDGYEACKLIKSDFRTNHIPVIMLTAKADIESKISGLHIGADMYLTKPFNAKELLACVENLIEIRENLKKKYSQIVSAKEANSEKLTNEFLISIKNLILDNLSNGDFGINEICKEIGVSRTQLHRKLKALSGLSTSIFVREIKLEEGHKLLLNTEMTISEIAYSIGFSSPDYFSKLFTQKFNASPLHYRQNK